MIAARITVVEDESIVALHLQQRLRKLGYDVPAIAASGKQALQHVKEWQPDVVLMDINIAGAMDGIETAARASEEFEIAVIFLSAYSEETTLERARSTGAHGYLIKPFSERELHVTIQMALERRRADMLSHDNEARLERLVEARTAELAAANLEVERETSERLKAEQALHQAQKMEAVGQLAGGVAHDFNNLLTVIIGSLVLIGSEPTGVPGVAELVKRATRAAERGARLIKQLLMFARRQAIYPETVDPNRLIAEFALLLERVTGENVELVMRLSPDLRSSCIDPSQFEAAIVNLVINAREALPGKGRIVLETRNAEFGPDDPSKEPELAAGRYVVVSVSDNGRGISPDVLPRVFDPFFTTKDVGEGSGLGLSQVHGFAKASGGHVALQTEVGVGTTINLYLPCAVGAAATGEAEPVAAPAQRPLVGQTVLVVEDDELVRDVAVDNLRAWGYQVSTAADASAALEILGGARPIDILFSDVVLPGGMNGVQLAGEAQRLQPAIKIILTSGHTAAALSADHGLDARLHVLEKPYRPRDLIAQFHALARTG